MEQAEDEREERCCKVGRVAAESGLADVDERLRTEQEAGASLRELADLFNRAVFVAAVERERPPSLIDPELLYERLTDEGTSSGRKTELRTKLEQAGVSVGTVEDDFVSYVTIRTHLQECLSVDTSRTASDPERTRDGIEWIRAKSEAIVDSKLETLRESGALRTGPLTATHTIHVRCEDCDTLYSLQELLREGTCECTFDDSGTTGGN